MGKNLEIHLPEWRLEAWKEMENRHAHGKRLERIADYCQTFAGDEGRAELYEITEVLNTINSLHERRGCLNEFLFNLRYATRERLISVIGTEFGPEALELIGP